ncbi:MAG: photosynthetic reaction center cytochrome c subunit [Acidobacteriia bacterium]|nr:photosynthetic reaction center cytochrome c subunit [Terriglobia bacterium]
MKLWSRPLMVAVTALAAVSLFGVAVVDRAAAQATQATPPANATAGTAFKNVTTASLKELTVADFLGSMGVMAAALGYDCADCHPGAGSDKVDWVIDTEKKKTARKMVDMVTGINKNYFAGVQNVTCFTCHHGRDMPATTIALDKLYGSPNDEHNDIVIPGQGEPSVDQIFDKYIAALGGAQKLNGLTSWVATGASIGYGGLGGGGSFQIFAKAPDSRAVIIEFKDHPERGDSTRVYNGKVGWVKSPRGLLSEYEQTGNELEGARLDALLSFPGRIKSALNNWRVGNPDDVNGHDCEVVQGRGPKGLLATLYFDRQTSLLVRAVRYSLSPIGRVPTQLDYDDYRVVEGIKFPFKYTFSWLDGKDAFQINDVKVNVPIEAAKFNKPAGK